MTTERHGAVTLDGRPLTVIGRPLQVGDAAPDFRLPNTRFQPISLADSAGRVRLVSVVPSLVTPVCDAQTRRFDQEADALGDDVVLLTVTAEPPLNAGQWCRSAGVDQIEILSDHMSMSFGDAYGTHIKETRQEQRAVFVIEREGKIAYAEYVPEIGQHPDYEAALTAVRRLLQ